MVGLLGMAGLGKGKQKAKSIHILFQVSEVNPGRTVLPACLAVWRGMAWHEMAWEDVAANH